MSAVEFPTSSPLRFAVLTVSDTRTQSNDRSGDLLAERIARDGHAVAARGIVRDEEGSIVTQLREWLSTDGIDVIVSTGGTGITGRDVTPEAFRRVLEKDLPGFGELFRSLSFQTIGTNAMLSRALGGIAQGKYLFALPGSPAAVADAWDQLLGKQFDRNDPACNLAELIPRLRENV